MTRHNVARGVLSFIIGFIKLIEFIGCTTGRPVLNGPGQIPLRSTFMMALRIILTFPTSGTPAFNL